MLKKLCNYTLKRIIIFTFIIIMILNIFSPYMVYASSYDDLRNLIVEIEEDPEVASAFWTSMGTVDLPRPNRDTYKDEYIDAMTKWVAVQFIPDIDRNNNEELKDALLWSEPFYEEYMPKDIISDEQYQTGFNNLNKAYEEYNKTLEEGGSKDDALSEGGGSLNQDITDKVEQDVQTGMSNGADIWDGGLQEIGVGGILLDPIFNFVLAICDAINGTLQSIMYSGEDSNGPLGNILSAIGETFDIMTDETSDAEFDSKGTSSQIKVKIIQRFFGTAYPHFHYSCEEIFSGKVGILGIDFISGEGQTEGLANVRVVIASWYKTLRLIAIVGFLSILIYTGIRIMISSAAEDKAKYKEWIINWFIGIGILFCMHYIMSFIITIVQTFNESLSQSMEYISVQANVEHFLVINDINATFNTNLIGLVRFCAQSSVPLFKVGYLILYVMLTTFTVKFTFIYLKRVINMAFLTLIAPIVAFTYPLDKLSDGKAEGFNMWLKEYVFNALLQPMHFLLYYILVGSSIMIAAENPIYAIAVMAFMSEGERLLRKIFGFDKASGGTVKGMQDAFAAATIATSLRGLMSRGGQKNSAQRKMPAPGGFKGDLKNGIAMNNPNINSGAQITSGTGGNPIPDSGGNQRNTDSDSNGNGAGSVDNNNPITPSQNENNPRVSSPQTNAQTSNNQNIQTTNSNVNKVGQKPLSIRQKALRTAKNVGKKAVRPIWDFDRTGKYNGKRLIRNVAKGVVGASLGITAAAVQAGISLADGKYHPGEGLASFAAGFGVGGRGFDGVANTFSEGYQDGLTKEEKMRAYQEDFRNREDVIEFCKQNYGDDWKQYRDRMTDNYVYRGFTDLSEMKEMIKYSNAITGDVSGLTDKQRNEKIMQSDIAAMSIKNVQRRKVSEGSMATVYNRDKEDEYIKSRTQGSSNPTEVANRIRAENAAIRYYNSIVKD